VYIFSPQPNKALDVFNTSVVTPILYVVFTSFVILASAVLFKEWGSLGALDIAGNICGFLTIVSGIFLLQAFKDLNVSISNLPKARRDASIERRDSDGANEPLRGDRSLYSSLKDAQEDELHELMNGRTSNGGLSRLTQDYIP